MLDASAKLPSGILSGNLNQFGDFDECLSVQGTDQHETIKGKYCLANVNIQKVDPTNKKLKVLDDSIHSHRFITNNLSDVSFIQFLLLFFDTYKNIFKKYLICSSARPSNS